MAIPAYVGLPGAGKSFTAVQNVIVPALKSGRVVVTNIPLNLDALAALGLPGRVIQREKKCPTQDWLDSPHGAVIVIDEVWNWWPAGTTADQIPATQKSFFAEHRHRVGTDGMATEIVLVTQDLSQIAAFLRQLVAETFRVTKLTAIGSKSRFRVDIYSGAVTGQTPPKGQMLRQLFGKYDPKIWALYSSHTMSKTGHAGLEEKADKRGTVFGSWTMKLAALALLLIPVAIWGINTALTSFKDQVTGKPADRRAAAAGTFQPIPGSFASIPPATAPAAQQLTPVAPPLAAPRAEKPKGPQLSGKWRIVGTISKKSGEGVALMRSATGQRRIDLTTCKKTGIDLDLKCEVDGDLVTYYSGDTGSFASAAIAPGTLAAN